MRIFCCMILCLLGVTTSEGAVDTDVLALVEQVASENIDRDVQRIVAFDTRFMGSDSNAAASVWLGDRLADLGYPVRFDTFEVNVARTYFNHSFRLSGLKQWNVIATKRGTLFPNRKVVLGAHYDSIAIDRAQSDQDVAPGAEDGIDARPHQVAAFGGPLEIDTVRVTSIVGSTRRFGCLPLRPLYRLLQDLLREPAVGVGVSDAGSRAEHIAGRL